MDPVCRSCGGEQDAPGLVYSTGWAPAYCSSPFHAGDPDGGFVPTSPHEVARIKARRKKKRRRDG